MIEIGDPTDPRVAPYTTLRDGELGAHARRGRGVFVAEGPSPVRRLLDSGWGVDSLLVEERRAAEAAAWIGARDSEVDLYVASREVLRAIVRFRLHQGVVALGLRPAPRTVADVVDGARLVVAFEQVNDHENLGVVFRSAAALGADAVLLGPGSCDPLYRRCVRVSMGHVLDVPFAATGAWPDAVAALDGLRTVALTPDAAVTAVDELADGAPSALLLGAEGPGLTPATMAAADVRARIPIAPGVDSLNVAVTASIALHVLRIGAATST